MTPGKQNPVFAQLACRYSAQPIESSLQDENTLAIIRFDGQCRPTQQPRLLNTGLSLLGESSSYHEIWTSSSPTQAGINENIYWSKCTDYQFLCTWINEKDYTSLNEATFQAYSKLLNYVKQSNHPHIVRAWNYLPAINQGDADNERYKQFCLGRHRAFNDLKITQYPAATATGHMADQMVIYLLSAAGDTSYFENPQQMNAYHYPRQYGPQSPTFSRASCLKTNPSTPYFISGTASIMGHKSTCINDIKGQIETTYNNITTLAQQITKERACATTPSLSMIKVYLRDPALVSITQQLVRNLFGESLPATYLQSDICRQDLLVEIDALYQLKLT